LVAVPVLVAHDPGCKYARPTGGGHSDAAKRVADVYNLHLVAGRSFIPNPNLGRVAAVALADGRSDGVLYDSLRDAVRHQHGNEQLFAYLRIAPHGMSVCAAEAFLRTHRLFFDAGWRLPDPDHRDGGHVPIPRLATEDNNRLLGALAARTWIPGRN
jgi:hypothetical protein